MEIALLVLWFALGIAGGAMFWWDWMVTVEERMACPSPRAILVIALLSPLGAIMFAPGLIISICRWVGNADWSESWWTRPLCGRD